MVDLIQHRYGWTDEVVFSLPYARFLDIFEMLLELKREESLEQYRLSAFTAYLLRQQDDGSFQDFVETLGIGRQQTSPQANRSTKEESLSKAYEILNKFNKK